MLQRAASNAYSWWWSSHIRTKQSKWLEHNLEDMEEKVKYIIEILEEDGDSFAKRAEMYYKKRPELISFVRDSYGSYRALAERYDHLSRELQNANRTIASAFPEQVQFRAEEEEENLQQSKHAISKRKYHMRKAVIAGTTPMPSGLSKEEALQEIDTMQKGILTLQTEKEFIKGCYENGYSKYCDIERRITEMQAKVSNLQDEFGIGTMIEDDEARKLMASTALKSCENTLSNLQQKQNHSSEEARVQRGRIDEAIEKLQTAKAELLKATECSNDHESHPEPDKLDQYGAELESLESESNEKHDVKPSSSITMSELADKIDELVNKVIYLETVISSQASLVSTLRSEIGKLHAHIESLNVEKDSTSVSNKLGELEEELRSVRNLNQNVEDENCNIRTFFAEARNILDHLSQELQSVKLDEIGDGALFRVSNSARDLGVENDHSEPHIVAEADPRALSVHVSEDNEISPDGSVVIRHVSTEGLNDSNFKFRDGGKTGSGGNLEATEAYKTIDEPVVESSCSTAQSPLEACSEASTISFLTPRQRLLSEFLLKPIDPTEKPESVGFSSIEAKFRSEIDSLLEGNVDFYFRFSASLHQIQKFKSSVDDLHSELLKLKNDGSRKHQSIQSLESEVRPIYRHLREIQTQLALWSDENSLLKYELETGLLSLDEISAALDIESPEPDKYQAAKLQGEVLNMKRERERVMDEVESGLDRAKRVQDEVEITLLKLDEEFGVRNRGVHSRQRANVSRIPLRSFLFGVKMKKQKPSIFSCMSPTLQKQYSDLGYGASLPRRKPRV